MSSPVTPAVTPGSQSGNDQTRELLQFLREQNDANRTAIRNEAEANRKLLLDTVKFVSIPVAMLIAIAGFLGFRSISDLKATLEAEARRSTQSEIKTMQGEIQKELNEQFQTPSLKAMVQNAAAEYTRTAAEPLIKRNVEEQVKARVAAERPTIIASVAEQTKAAVRQMEPQINLQVRDSVEATVQHQVEPVTKQIDGLKTEVAKLSARTQPRILSADQQSILVKRWKQFSGRKVYAMAVSYNTEGIGLCNQIVSVLVSAGTTVSNGCGSIMFFGGGVDYGIQITYTDPDADFANALSKGLVDANIKADAAPGPGKMDHVQIFVQLNPALLGTPSPQKTPQGGTEK